MAQARQAGVWTAIQAARAGSLVAGTPQAGARQVGAPLAREAAPGAEPPGGPA